LPSTSERVEKVQRDALVLLDLLEWAIWVHSSSPLLIQADVRTAGRGVLTDAFILMGEHQGPRFFVSAH
jgi:hypothetical protein